MFEEAIVELKSAVNLSGSDPEKLSYLAHAYAVSGSRSEALDVLDRLSEFSKQRYIPPFYIATVYAGLGERDRAFEWLEKAYEERDEVLVLLRVDPMLDSLRADPRFAVLLRRIGLGA